MHNMTFVLRKLFNPSALHNAIRKNNEAEALNLIKNKFNINSYDAGCNALQLSLIYDMYKCTLALLEKDVNPDLYYKTTKNEKTIQPHVTGEEIFNVKLLALYGATTKDVQFNQNNLYLKDFINHMNLIYQKRKELENRLASTANPEDKRSILNEISALWETAAQDEKNKIYREFYFKKTEECTDKIRELSSTIISKTNSIEVSYRQNSDSSRGQENEPLLASKLKVQ
jgi:hypothetical protein